MARFDQSAARHGNVELDHAHHAVASPREQLHCIRVLSSDAVRDTRTFTLGR
jgi:hypothetical protein